MPKPVFELAGIFRQHGDSYRRTHKPPLQQLRVMRAIEVCRTATLGGHVEACSQCSHTRIAYNSCRNRHCPKCQNTERARWLRARTTAGSWRPGWSERPILYVPAAVKGS